MARKVIVNMEISIDEYTDLRSALLDRIQRLEKLIETSQSRILSDEFKTDLGRVRALYERFKNVEFTVKN